jgi:ribose/xylose/arabinose/galactoside ABC-type transport system permease subunit
MDFGLKLLHGSRSYAIIFYFIILCAVIGSISPNFLSSSNLFNNLRSASYYGIICMGMTMVFISGGLDLSVGSVVGLSSLITALALRNEVSVPLSIMLGLLVGLIIGLINGFCVIKLRIPAMIVTLGMMFIARGFINVITEGKPVYPLPDAFNAISTTNVWGLNISVCFLIVLAVIVEFILRKTTYGRSIYAIGGNAETARLSGIRVDRISMSVYMVSGLCASVAGIFITSRITSAQVTTGSSYEMDVIAATIIGGTSLFGGVGTAIGAFFGALFMTFLKAGIVSMRLSAYWQNVVIGIILIVTVGADQYQRRKRAKS